MSYTISMTDSYIYQLVGKAYCDGMVEGISKQASLEKKALNFETILDAASKAGITNKNRELNLIGRILPRLAAVNGAFETAGDAVNRRASAIYNKLLDLNMGSAGIIGSVFANMFSPVLHAGKAQGSGAAPGYAAAINKLIQKNKG